VFQAISNAIVRILHRNNFKSISYIYDFLLVADSQSECQAALDFLLELIPRLGLSVNFDKVSQPATTLSFLGVQIDCVARTLALPPDKLAEAKILVGNWNTKRRCKKKDLQRLIGKLSWCARVVCGGRTFLRNIINLMSSLKAPHHYT
jgi:hypothetical protein